MTHSEWLAALALADDATIARMTERAWREAARCWREAALPEHRPYRAMLTQAARSADDHWRLLNAEHRARGLNR